MDFNVHKICRVCLEEGAPSPLTSIYSTDFAMMPSQMLMMCSKIRVRHFSQLFLIIKILMAFPGL